MDHYHSEDKPVTPEDVRRWGYDEEYYLADQDEDLILHDTQYVPALIDLVADSKCPKGEYALGILQEFSDFCIAHRHSEFADDIYRVIKNSPPLRSSRLTDWATDYLALYSRLKLPGEFSFEEACQFARRILLGPNSQFDLKPTDRKIGSDLEFEVGNHTRILYVNRRTGKWRTTSYRPLQSEELGD